MTTILTTQELRDQEYKRKGRKLIKCRSFNRIKFNSKKVKRRTKGFFESDKWQKLRLSAFEVMGKTCMRCGSNKRLQVDHVFPFSYNTKKRGRSLKNLQILCMPCNLWKSNIYYIDYRTYEDLNNIKRYIKG